MAKYEWVEDRIETDQGTHVRWFYRLSDEFKTAEVGDESWRDDHSEFEHDTLARIDRAEDGTFYGTIFDPDECDRLGSDLYSGEMFGNEDGETFEDMEKLKTLIEVDLSMSKLSRW